MTSVTPKLCHLDPDGVSKLSQELQNGVADSLKLTTCTQNTDVRPSSSFNM